MKKIPLEQVAKHNTKEDCWVIIHGKVYDLTNFLDEHPGGSGIILKYAGTDATHAFDPIHPGDIIKKLLPPSVLKGEVDSVKVAEKQQETVKLPPLDSILNLNDFECVAKDTLRRDGWAYYSSGADDEITYRENRNAFHRIWLKPRVLVDVRKVNTTSTILNYPTSFPVYITATALGKLGHPEGEVILTKAAGKEGIIQMIPTLSSCSLEEITNARINDKQTQFFQLYVNSNRTITMNLIRDAERRGCKAIFITVDAPTLAKREKDMRMKFIENTNAVHTITNRTQGAARAIGTFIDASLNWNDIAWFRSITKLPLVLKGIQCAEDAVLAAKHGMDGIVVSNHGGRQLDFARSAIEILPEVVDALKKEDTETARRMEIYIDGGIRRGTDIFKAIALGAKAVGIGRPFLYAMAYGVEGVERGIQILKDEFEMCMRLMGVCSLSDINDKMLCVRNLNDHVSIVPKDYLMSSSYERMQPPKSKL